MNEKIPEFLIKKLEIQYGKDITDKILKGYECDRKTTIRVNSIKSNIDEVCNALDEANIKYSKVDWYENALILENAVENKISEMNIYSEGKIYLQSLSSMIPAIILNPKENENILDMAAAPGGKTTQMYSISNGKAHITACEKNKIRSERLKYNIEKQGATRIGILAQDARKLDDFFSFDKILLDAPCSGSGTLETQNAKVMQSFSEELINRSVKVQKELLDKALKLIKVGNELIYSTCSILEEENEGYLKELLKKGTVEVVPISLSDFEGIPILPVQLEGTICVCPTELYEGFFVAKLKKLR
ncbi:MAG: RsmB/NOP family class I SAM-dependent RNA methyltransferase [Clostridia bacterium]|nr:RsmB/NOP family class I SAM-dependent RNA methyltransferase [Clostridia bacterium]